MKIKIEGFGKYDNNYRFQFSCSGINFKRDYLITFTSEVKEKEHLLKTEFVLICKKAESDFALLKYKDNWRDHVKHDPAYIEDLWKSVKLKYFT